MTKLAVGANGFGSHVTRRLVAGGHDVRVMVRESANTTGIDDLDVQRFVGDIWDDDILRRAMSGCDDDVLLRSRHPRLAQGSGAAVPHQRRRNTKRWKSPSRSTEMARLRTSSHTSTYATVGRRRE